MQSAPAPTTAPTDTTTPPPLFHRAHRCHQQPGTQTYCGLKLIGPPLTHPEARKRIPCVVCNDLQQTMCELCKEMRP